jgi:hypothetical protein
MGIDSGAKAFDPETSLPYRGIVFNLSLFSLSPARLMVSAVHSARGKIRNQRENKDHSVAPNLLNEPEK